jgi:hypothetical protein
MNNSTDVAVETTESSLSYVTVTGSIIQETTPLQQWAEFYSSVNFKLVPLYNHEKHPSRFWMNQNEIVEQEEAEVNWSGVTGLAAIMGYAGVTVIDFDQIQDWSIKDDVLQALQLPKDYEWTYYTGSGCGLQIAIRTFDASYGIKTFIARDKTRFDHGELRLSKGVSTLPPTKTVKGIYEFVHGFPTDFPALIPFYKIEAAIETLATLPEKCEHVENEHSEPNVTPQIIQDVAFLLSQCADHYEYQDWRSLCFAVISVLGEEAQEVLESRYETKAGEIPQMIHSHEGNTDRNEVTVKTLLYYAKENGWKFSWKDIPGLAEVYQTKKAPANLNMLVDTEKRNIPSNVIYEDVANLLTEPVIHTPNLVAGWMKAVGLYVVAGEEGAGKTMLNLNLAVCVCLGKPWLGRTVMQGKVLYLDNESEREQFKERIQKMMKGEKLLPGTFKILFDAPVMEAKYVEAEIEAFKPSLVIIDSFYLATNAKEKDNDSLKEVLRQLKGLSHKYQCVIQFITHFHKGTRFEKLHQDMIVGGGSQNRIVNGSLLMRTSDKDETLRILKPGKLRDQSSKEKKARLLSFDEDTFWFKDEGIVDEEEHIAHIGEPKMDKKVDIAGIFKKAGKVDMTRDDILKIALDLGYSESTVDRAIRREIEKTISREKWGSYQLLGSKPPKLPAVEKPPEMTVQEAFQDGAIPE